MGLTDILSIIDKYDRIFTDKFNFEKGSAKCVML